MQLTFSKKAIAELWGCNSTVVLNTSITVIDCWALAPFPVSLDSTRSNGELTYRFIFYLSCIDMLTYRSELLHHFPFDCLSITPRSTWGTLLTGFEHLIFADRSPKAIKGGRTSIWNLNSGECRKSAWKKKSAREKNCVLMRLVVVGYWFFNRILCCYVVMLLCPWLELGNFDFLSFLSTTKIAGKKNIENAYVTSKCHVKARMG